jgi:hypothetical protein
MLVFGLWRLSKHYLETVFSIAHSFDGFRETVRASRHHQYALMCPQIAASLPLGPSGTTLFRPLRLAS